MKRNPAKPSGAAFRKQRKTREQKEKLEEAARRAVAGEGLTHEKHYASRGEQPTEPTDAAPYMLAVTLGVVEETLADPVIDAAVRRKTLLEAAKAIAQLSPKATYGRRMLELEKLVYGKRRDADDVGEDGLEDLPVD